MLRYKNNHWSRWDWKFLFFKFLLFKYELAKKSSMVNYFYLLYYCITGWTEGTKYIYLTLIKILSYCWFQYNIRQNYNNLILFFRLISFVEFQAFESLLSEPDALYKVAFHLFDINGNGVISYGTWIFI